MSDVDVVVVGGGIAGLTAARAVAAAGRSVRVLEARDRVGGRTMDHTFENGAVVELGGQHIGPVQTEVLALLEELGLETFPTYDEGASLMIRDGSRTRFEDESFGLPEASLPEVGRLQEEIESLAATVPLSAPWEAPDAGALDRQTFEEWLRANAEDEVARRFFQLVANAVFSAEARELSLLHALFYISSNGMIANIAATTDGNQERRVVGGSQRISERLAEELPADALRLGARVHTICQNGQRVVVSHDAGEVTGRRVIVTLPPTLAGRIHYDPPLPARRDGLTQQMPMGCAIKVQAVYPTAFWRDEGLNGQILSDGLLSLVYDNSPPDASCGVIMGLIEGDHARDAAQESPERRRARVTEFLAGAFGPRAGEPIEYVEQDWMAEEFTRGCYSGHFGPGVWTRYGSALAAPVGLIHWAGTETADRSNGYMDGAVRSGRRAAREVLAALQ